jgi:hypothetical protein
MSEALQTIGRDWRPKVCAACGAEFSCGALSAAGCWCAGLKLSDATRAELGAKYEGCLCRDCLAAYAARESEDRPLQ